MKGMWKKASSGFTVPTPNHMVFPDYLKMILTSRVYDVAVETPLQRAKNLSLKTKNNVLLKREDLQPVFSFKCRGAYNRMANLSQEEKEKGVLTCSAGNHAQGVALAAKHLQIRATIVMPVFTPQIKVNSVRALGAEVVLHGNDFDQARAECERLSALEGRLVIHPFDDPYVIAGQGTIGVEIVRQHHHVDGPLHAVFCAVGGGGLIAGVGSYLKSVMPSIKIIGVEAVDAAAMYHSLAKGDRVELSEVGLFADGAAVRLCGKENFRICKDVVDEMVLVTNDEICAAIKDTFEDTRSILEPAGALAVAGAKRWVQQQKPEGLNLVAVTSGANMNFNRLGFVASRAEIGEQREALFCVTIPERPGSFMKLYSVIHPRSVTEFSYRFNDSEKALVYIAFEVSKGKAEVAAVMSQLKAEGLDALDLSDNELAKNHARYLGGGRAKVPNEKMFRFEFPERPGALMRFLQNIRQDSEGSQWNVTCFHYRNFGADFGKVLAGIQVPQSQEEKFQKFLRTLGYQYVDESHNPVYDIFFKP